MDRLPASGGRLMSLRSRIRNIVIQSASVLQLDEVMLTILGRGASYIHAVNFHGTPVASRETLVRQLEWLRSRFAVLDPMALGSIGEKEEALLKPTVLLTFDDGLASNFFVAARVLESLGLCGLFFVNPGFALLEADAARDFFRERLAESQSQPLTPEEWTPMTPAQIAELAGRGHAIGNHTFSHADLSRTYGRDLTHEIVGSRDLLAQWTGRRIEYFAWTYRWNALSLEAWDLARSHHRWCFAPCSGLTWAGGGKLATAVPGLIWRTNVESRYSESEYRFAYSGLATIPAWRKRGRLEREIHLRTGPPDRQGEERRWLLR